MTLEEAIHDTLMDDGPILAVLVSDKVWYGPVQQGGQLSAPYIRFWAVSRVSDETFGGDVGPLRTRMQFDCYAASMPEARDLARLVRGVLQSWQGLMPAGNPSGVMVQSALCDGDAGRDGYDDAVSLCVCSVDLVFTVKDN